MSSQFCLSVSTPDGSNFTTLTVTAATRVSALKPLIQQSMGIPVGNQQLLYANTVMQDHQSLADFGMSSDDIIVVKYVANAASAPDAAAIIRNAVSHLARTVPTGISEAEARRIKNEFVSNPHQMSIVRERDAQFAAALDSPDIKVLQSFIDARQEQKRKQEAEHAARMARLAANPFSEEAQRAIQEEIEKKNVHDNYEAAMEHLPESFTQVQMLYVPCYINGNYICAFVDSGAQSTIISKGCAERCGLLRMVDRRFKGVAQGVGSAEIIGRVHLVQMQFGSHFYNCSLTVLDSEGVDFLFGLDMLKRHQACIDLKSNALRVGEETVPFLSEAEVVKYKQGRILQPEAKIPEKAPEAPEPARPSGVSETDVSSLMGLGFSREQCIDALTKCSSVDLAATYLFNNQQ